MGFSFALEQHFVIGFISTGLLVLIGLFLMRSYAKIKLRASYIFGTASFCGATWACASTVYPAMPDAASASTIYIVGVIASYVMISLIFVFVELVKEDRVRTGRAYFFGALFGAISFLLVMQLPAPIGFAMPLRSDFGYYAAAQPPFLVLQLLFILSVSIEFTATILQMRRAADTPKRRAQTTFLLVGSTIAFYGAIIALVLVEIFFVPSTVLLVTAIGIFLIAISFGRDPEVAYFLPYDVSILVVLDKSGMPLFTHHFSGFEIDEILFTGAISAIGSLMKESLKTRESIKLIQMESRSMVLDLREEISAFVITNQGGLILQQGLAVFLSAFETKYGEIIKNGQTSDLSVFKDAHQLVAQYLGFLRGSTAILMK